MPSILLYLLAMGVLVMEGVVLAVFGVEGWSLQTPLALTIYLGLEREFTRGGLILAGLLFPIEWLIAGVPGVYSLGLVLIFFVMSALRRQVQPAWGIARAMLAGVASIIHSLILMGGFVMLLGSGSGLVGAVSWKMGQAALSTALVTIAMGRVFGRLEGVMNPRKGRNQLEF